MTEIKLCVTGNSDGAYWHSIMQYGLISFRNYPKRCTQKSWHQGTT